MKPEENNTSYSIVKDFEIFLDEVTDETSEDYDSVAAFDLEVMDRVYEAQRSFEKLKELLVDELQIDEADITLDAELSGDLGINSIELADLVMLCEEKFNIEIEDGDLHKLVTVGDVVNYLESL